MLNYLWGFMILIGIGFGMVTGQVEALSNAAIDSAGEAVTLAITMLGIMAMWTGLMEIGRQSGLMDKMTTGLRPVLRFLFPKIPWEHKVNEYLAANIIANILGLGWAATPMGLKAMEQLAVIHREKWEKEKEKYRGQEEKIEKINKRLQKASNEMCTFLVVNISSLQVIPVSVIAYRSQYGAVNPVGIVMPGLIATTVSTVAGILFCKLMCRLQED